MKPTIFARIMIGYLAIFIPMAAVSAVAFSQLALYRGVTDDILQIDNRMRDLVQKISDSVLAQTRYERKYIITKDKEFFNQFVLVEEDVHARIDEAISIANDAHKKEILIRIKNSYEHYKATFNEEVGLVEVQQPYLQNIYQEEKVKTVDGILLDLQNLKLYIEQDTYEKIKHLGESVEKANQIAIVMAAGFIFLGIITSIFITRSITIPLSFMRKNTANCRRGF